MTVRPGHETCVATDSRKKQTALQDAANCCLRPVLNPEEAVPYPYLVPRSMVSKATHDSKDHYLRTRLPLRFAAIGD